jgi:hypothetical protein
MTDRVHKITPFKDAQAKLLSSMPDYFTFNKPPPLGWWRAKFEFGLAAVAFIHHFQSILGAQTFGNNQGYAEMDFTARWQAMAGISEKQWNGARHDLGPTGADLMTFRGGSYSGGKGMHIRPTNRLLSIFGLSLATYDLVAGLDARISMRQFRAKYRVGIRKVSAKGVDAARAAERPISDEEWCALSAWASCGGLARLRNAGYLGTMLEESHTANPAP